MLLGKKIYFKTLARHTVNLHADDQGNDLQHNCWRKFEFLFGCFNITAFINIHLLNVCLNNFYNSGFDTKSTTIKSSNQFSAVTSHILHFLSSCVSEYSSAVLYYCFFKDIVGQGKSQIMRDLSSYDN